MRQNKWSGRDQTLLSVGVGRVMCRGRPRHERALRTILATVFLPMPFRLQYSESSQVLKSFVPLLALHDMQHLAMFSLEMILALLMMCSQDGRAPRGVDLFLKS